MAFPSTVSLVLSPTPNFLSITTYAHHAESASGLKSDPDPTPGLRQLGYSFPCVLRPKRSCQKSRLSSLSFPSLSLSLTPSVIDPCSLAQSYSSGGGEGNSPSPPFSPPAIAGYSVDLTPSGALVHTRSGGGGRLGGGRSKMKGHKKTTFARSSPSLATKFAHGGGGGGGVRGVAAGGDRTNPAVVVTAQKRSTSTTSFKCLRRQISSSSSSSSSFDNCSVNMDDDFTARRPSSSRHRQPLATSPACPVAVRPVPQHSLVVVPPSPVAAAVAAPRPEPPNALQLQQSVSTPETLSGLCLQQQQQQLRRSGTGAPAPSPGDDEASFQDVDGMDPHADTFPCPSLSRCVQSTPSYPPNPLLCSPLAR